MRDMLELVDQYLSDAGLYDGWTSQLEFWNDTEVGTDRFMVLQSNGGTNVSKDLSNDYYFSLYVVGQHGQYNIEETKAKALDVIAYIKDHPVDSCIGMIQLQAPLGRPTLTTEKRPVYELLLRVVFGE